MGCSHGMGDGHVRQYRRRKNPWRRLCGAHSRTTGKPSQAPGNGRGGRCKMHGGKCTRPKTEAGRAKISRVVRDALLRSWAKWDPKARIKRLLKGKAIGCGAFAGRSLLASSERACDDHARGRLPRHPKGVAGAATGLRCGGVQPSARRRNLAQTTANQCITVSGEIPALSFSKGRLLGKYILNPLKSTL
jgi:hypothetical protein